MVRGERRLEALGRLGPRAEQEPGVVHGHVDAGMARRQRRCTGAHQIEVGEVEDGELDSSAAGAGHDPPDGLLPADAVSGGEHGDRTHRRQGRRGRLTHARVGPGHHHGRALERRGRPGAAHKRRWSSAATRSPDRMAPSMYPAHTVADSVPDQWMRPHGCRRAGPNWLSVPGASVAP